MLPGWVACLDAVETSGGQASKDLLAFRYRVRFACLRFSYSCGPRGDHVSGTALEICERIPLGFGEKLRRYRGKCGRSRADAGLRRAGGPHRRLFDRGIRLAADENSRAGDVEPHQKGCHRIQAPVNP